MHFNASKQLGNKFTYEALRAIAAQLINHGRENQALVDALSILFDESRETQQASDETVDGALLLLLAHARTYIIIDGVDECSDHSIFWRRIMGIATTTEVKIVLLGRPDIEIPRSYRKLDSPKWQVTFHSADNQHAIQAFLQQQLRDLQDDDLFGDQELSDEIIIDLAIRANGMFLWAQLLILYLECDALSPLERHKTLRNANLIEGLSRVYNKILETLRTRYAKQKQVAADIFRWLSASVCPINPAELRIAIAITPGEPTSDLAMLTNYPQCLPKITCALVDVIDGKYINFIHMSFVEFLETDVSCDPYFTLRSRNAINLQLSNTCLSYLVLDVPAKPLRPLQLDPSLEAMDATCSGQARHQTELTPSQNRSLILHKYPFLRYAALCWPFHLNKGVTLDRDAEIRTRQPRDFHDRNSYIDQSEHSLILPGNNSNMELSEYFHRDRLLETHSIEVQGSRDQLAIDEGRANTQRPMRRGVNRQATSSTAYLETSSSNFGASPVEDTWISLLSRFLLNRLSVTMWVEACWSFSMPPNLSKLLPIASYLYHERDMSASHEREKAWTGVGITTLVEALAELQEKHRMMLLSNPTLIWQRHIVSATDPAYWPTFLAEQEPDEFDEAPRLISVRAGVAPEDRLRAVAHARPSSSLIS